MAKEPSGSSWNFPSSLPTFSSASHKGREAPCLAHQACCRSLVRQKNRGPYRTLKSMHYAPASSSARIEPHPYLVVGERVRIMAGVMAGVEGVLVRKKNDLRVVLSLDTIMRSVAVEVDADDIEPCRLRHP